MLSIRHLTEYTYKQPVSFGDHRIMVRPRESFDQRLIEVRRAGPPCCARRAK